MSDSWTDGKSRCLVNFLINSPAGTWFLKSVDASDTIKNGELMFNYIDKVIDEIGEDNVVQLVTDNGSNYVNAGKRLMEKRVKLWWTPCAAHCIDLMLEDIGKLKVFATIISMSKQVVKFIYRHGWVLALMRSHTQDREIIRPAITRFATAFLTLQSLYKQKIPLQAMFSSEKYCASNYAKNVEGVKARATVLFDRHFWQRVAFCVKSTVPLVNVLREVDSEDKPSMGFIYELMDTAKEKIAFNCGGVESKYLPIWRKIDARWTPQLHRPLHAAGYYLNPQLRFEEKFSNVEEVKQGLHECMDRMMLNYADRLKADVQLDLYDQGLGKFGSRVAIDSRKLRSPAAWWMRFGSSKCPELTRFAIRVLNLTCSASGCERNWSTFQMIHTKKRNRLEHQRLNALAYVMYNTRLRERRIRRRVQNIDPIVMPQIDSDDEWIAEKEPPILDGDNSWLNEERLFDVEAIRNLSITSLEGSQSQSLDTTLGKRKVYEGSSGVKGKEKAAKVIEVDDDDDDDVEIEEVEVEVAMGSVGENDTMDDGMDDPDLLI